MPHPETKAMRLAEGEAQKGPTTIGTETIDVPVHKVDVQETDHAPATGTLLLEATESLSSG